MKMARANRHFISGYAWHLTHRCILNFTVTSNHVHLLVYDTGYGSETILKSIQLIAGKTGQAFNARQARKDA